MTKKQRRSAKLFNAARAYAGGYWSPPQKTAKARVVRWLKRSYEAGDAVRQNG